MLYGNEPFVVLPQTPWHARVQSHVSRSIYTHTSAIYQAVEPLKATPDGQPHKVD